MDDDDDMGGGGGSQKHHIVAMLAAMITALIFFVWVAVPVLNSQFVYGYPRIASLPGPNTFVDTRTTVFTIAIGLMAINGLLPYLLMTAVQENKVGEWGGIHVLFSGLAVFINVVVFLFLAITWCITCNNGLGISNTACQDPRYCCANFAINTKALLLCPNNGICTPDVSVSELGASNPYKGHFGFSLIFLFTAGAHLYINKRLTIYGVL